MVFSNLTLNLTYSYSVTTVELIMSRPHSGRECGLVQPNNLVAIGHMVTTNVHGHFN